jgi:hypothetical protein
MGSSGGPEQRHAFLLAAHQQAGWTVEQLWVQYLALGGTAVFFDVEAHLANLNALPLAQQDVLACALNERLADLDQPTRVPYALHPVQESDPADPLEVLDELLRPRRGPAGGGRPCLRWPERNCAPGADEL